ncbi:LAMI_0C00452g1_1 [Lachancea mirantina]|uniref:LAMI_0C00452g1_1 n=1 Tax=Lachancea mirantina TaxID=1230905 RepID=A0A1G4IZQ2_9SACH|nr:LAMI_0C00452g1_1 [Lachancea mirantina]
MGVLKRIYVGNIQKQFDSCIEELYGRFQRFGRCLDGRFECHDNFAFINMEFTEDSRFGGLKASFNGVKFKGNILRVEEAKLDWQARWRIDQSSDKSKEDFKKREWEYYKKIENINRSWTDRMEVIQGRMRKTERNKAQLRNITFRISKEGRLKVYKCYKNKLWGYERNKPLRDLVAKFSNKYWKDGNNHIVDKLDFSRSSAPFKTRAVKAHVSEVEDGKCSSGDEGNDNVDNILNSVLNTFDFDNPINLEHDDDAEDSASSDYEYTGIFKEGDTNDNQACDANESKKVNRKADQAPETDEDHDLAFTPNFKDERINFDEQSQPQATINDTETLRGLFNPEGPSEGFKLIEESDEDIDHANDEKINNQSEMVAPHAYDATLEVRDHRTGWGLFFPHFDSPFLHAQSQIAKLTNNSADPTELFDNWEEQFWDKRAAWTKEMKGRKRDAIRLMRKKGGGRKARILL